MEMMKSRNATLGIKIITVAILVPLLSSCAFRDAVQNLPPIESFGDYMKVSLILAVIESAFTFIFGRMGDAIVGSLFIVLLLIFTPYGFWMSLLVALGAFIFSILIGLIVNMLFTFVLYLFGRNK